MSMRVENGKRLFAGAKGQKRDEQDLWAFQRWIFLGHYTNFVKGGNLGHPILHSFIGHCFPLFTLDLIVNLLGGYGFINIYFLFINFKIPYFNYY